MPVRCRVQGGLTTAIVVSLALLSGSPGCSSSTPPETVVFATPTGLTLAGPRNPDKNNQLDHLFIANSAEDTLQVGVLGSEIDDFSFIPGEAVSFPLRIPAGPNPREIAATADGRYIVVLNGTGETLRLVDAINLTPARFATDGSLVVLSVGQPGANPTALVASPGGSPDACAAPCVVGRFYVALAGTGQILAVELQTHPVVAGGVTAEDASLVPVRVYEVGGAPTALAIDSTGQTLFIADTDTDTVARLDLPSGQVLARADVGSSPGTVAVTQDNGVVLVARPALRDVLLFETTLTIVDADPVFSPPPTCVPSCDAPAECTGAHPADTALCECESNAAAAVCEGGTALASTATGPYGAVYLGRVPVRIQTIAGNPSNVLDTGEPNTADDGLAIRCGDVTRTFSQYAAVATLDGVTLFVGVRIGASDPLTPGLASWGWCSRPTAGATQNMGTDGNQSAPDPALYLAPCETVPGRSRFACAAQPFTSDGVAIPRADVVVMPGSGVGGRWSLDWEGVFVDQTQNGGTLDLTNMIFRTGLNLASFDVRVGDTLQITSAKRQGCPGDETGERLITAIDASNNGTALTLASPPIPIECYVEGATLGFVVRLHESFLVSGPGRSARVPPGGRYGPGGNSGRNDGLLFQLRSRDELESAGLTMRATEAPAGFIRPTFDVTDPFSSIVATVGFGQTPGDLKLLPHPSLGPMLFMTYDKGFNGVAALIGFIPFDPTMFTMKDSYLFIER